MTFRASKATTQNAAKSGQIKGEVDKQRASRYVSTSPDCRRMNG